VNGSIPLPFYFFRDPRTFSERQVGRMLRFLDHQRLTQRTLLIYCSDHGSMLGDHGLTDKHTLHAVRRFCMKDDSS
jgi:hypothetical protein